MVNEAYREKNRLPNSERERKGRIPFCYCAVKKITSAPSENKLALKFLAALCALRGEESAVINCF